MENKHQVLYYFIFILLFTNCKNISDKRADNEPEKISEEFKEYWYTGEAEITSYELEQARYGEIREGTAVLIFVTEDFLLNEQVKTDNQNNKSASVLKLNATKNFNTGIYPYSIMESTFYPVTNHRHALKVSASVQEWCGQSYIQINKRDGLEITSHSYFEGEADEHFTIYHNYLENELWNQIRVNPGSLPTGTIQIIPSLEYIRLQHATIKAYQAEANLKESNSLNIYTLYYPDLERELKIYFQKKFPYQIEKWEETITRKEKKHTTTAIKTSSIKTDYWNKNSNKDLPLREDLKLN